MAGQLLNLGPLLKGAFLAGARCLIWAHLGTTWDTEVACYNGTTLEQIQVQSPKQAMSGTFYIVDQAGSEHGGVTWIIQPSGAFQLGYVDEDGTSNFMNGQF